jgi:hypothetical protein
MSEFIVPRLEKLDSQPNAKDLLLRFMAENKEKSYLWIGQEGVGKKTHALAFVRSLFCKEGPECSGCTTCKQVLSRTHPDLFWLHKDYFWTPEQRDIKSNQILISVARHLEEKINQSAFSAPCKVAVIPDADDMNSFTQDAILKTFENPPPNTIIILLSTIPARLNPTVLSRCQSIRFPLLPDLIVKKILSKTYGWDEKDSTRAANEAMGNLTLGLKFGNKDWVEFHDKIQTEWDKALQGGDGIWLGLGNELNKLDPEFLELGEVSAAVRQNAVLNEAFWIYLTLWSQRLFGKVETPENLSTLTPDKVMKCINKHRDLLQTTIPAKMIFDHFFLELGRGFETGELEDRPFMDLAVDI